MNRLLICALGTILTTAVSFSSLASIANHVTVDVTSIETASAATICYYRPKVWMGPSQRGFSIVQQGHVGCPQQYGVGVLYHVEHVYQQRQGH